MSRNSLLGAVSYETESSFGENVATAATRLAVLGRVDLSGLSQPKIPVDILRQRPHEGIQDIRGPMGGSFTLEMMVPGMGSTQSGAVGSSDFATLMGHVVGNAVSSAASGTTLSGGTAAAPTTVASGTFSAGALCRIGALGDGDGEGQAYAIATHVTTTLTLLNQLAGAPVNGAILYTGKTIHPSENSSAETIQSLRFALRTGNQQVIAHGCYPTALSITGLNPGEQPRVSITFGVAWWEYAADTFPVTATYQTAPGMTCAAGSLFVNAVGTTTRAVVSTMRQFEVSVMFEHVAQMGQGGIHSHQVVVGCKRTKCQAEVSWVEDAEAAATNPTHRAYFNTDENAVVNKHALYTANARDGGSMALYFPNLKMVGESPQQVDQAGINAVRLRFLAMTGPTTTSDLTLSNWRMGVF